MVALMILSAAMGEVSVYVATPIEAAQQMLLAAGVSRTDVVYDLGCGDGRIVVLAAKEFGARGVGIDIEPRCVEAARKNAARNGVASLVRIYRGDVLQTDFSAATVVTAWLMPGLLADLIPRFQALKPGTRIVCYEKAIPGLKPGREIGIKLRGGGAATLYVYTAPITKCSGGT